jgi:hypothetical protein
MSVHSIGVSNVSIEKDLSRCPSTTSTGSADSQTSSLTYLVGSTLSKNSSSSSSYQSDSGSKQTTPLVDRSVRKLDGDSPKSDTSMTSVSKMLTGSKSTYSQSIYAKNLISEPLPTLDPEFRSACLNVERILNWARNISSSKSNNVSETPPSSPEISKKTLLDIILTPLCPINFPLINGVIKPNLWKLYFFIEKFEDIIELMGTNLIEKYPDSDNYFEFFELFLLSSAIHKDEIEQSKVCATVLKIHGHYQKNAEHKFCIRSKLLLLNFFSQRSDLKEMLKNFQEIIDQNNDKRSVKEKCLDWMQKHIKDVAFTRLFPLRESYRTLLKQFVPEDKISEDSILQKALMCLFELEKKLKHPAAAYKYFNLLRKAGIFSYSFDKEIFSQYPDSYIQEFKGDILKESPNSNNGTIIKKNWENDNSTTRFESPLLTPKFQAQLKLLERCKKIEKKASQKHLSISDQTTSKDYFYHNLNDVIAGYFQNSQNAAISEIRFIVEEFEKRSGNERVVYPCRPKDQQEVNQGKTLNKIKEILNFSIQLDNKSISENYFNYLDDLALRFTHILNNIITYKKDEESYQNFVNDVVSDIAKLHFEIRKNKYNVYELSGVSTKTKREITQNNSQFAQLTNALGLYIKLSLAKAKKSDELIELLNFWYSVRQKLFEDYNDFQMALVIHNSLMSLSRHFKNAVKNLEEKYPSWSSDRKQEFGEKGQETSDRGQEYFESLFSIKTFGYKARLDQIRNREKGKLQNPLKEEERYFQSPITMTIPQVEGFKEKYQYWKSSDIALTDIYHWSNILDSMGLPEHPIPFPGKNTFRTTLTLELQCISDVITQFQIEKAGSKVDHMELLDDAIVTKAKKLDALCEIK